MTVVFLPCLQSCADALDIDSKEHSVTLLFFSFLAEQRTNLNSKFKGCFSPAYQKKVYDAIIDTMNNEWSGKDFEEIKDHIEIVRKVHASLELEGEHLDQNMDVEISILELARYLNDENEVYIVTNYKEKLYKKIEQWKKSIQDGDSINFNMVTPSQAIYLIKKDNN